MLLDEDDDDDDEEDLLSPLLLRSLSFVLPSVELLALVPECELFTWAEPVELLDVEPPPPPALAPAPPPPADDELFDDDRLLTFLVFDAVEDECD